VPGAAAAHRTRVLSLFFLNLMSAEARLRTAARRAMAVALIAAAGAAVWFLQYGGRHLQHEDPLQKVDAIFVPSGTRLERPLEAVDLYHAGYAPIVALSPGRPESGEALLRARGIHYPSESEILRDTMVQLGVPASAIIAPGGSVDNTAAEADMLRALVEARHWRRVMIVSSKYHTRRVGFAFRRALEGTGAEVFVRASRYDLSDPAHWWRSRADFRFVTSEWEKLILYHLGLAG
jgi:uncharacterized SAM-binding protein YcdF (DUF218 family)